MPVSDAVAGQVSDQLKDWTPGKTETPKEDVAPNKRAETGFDVGQKLSDFGGDLAARAKKGIAGVDELEKALIYGIARPFMPDQVDPKSAIGKMMLPFEPSKESQDQAKNPKTMMGKVLGGAAEGAASMLALPVPGGIARNIIAGVGMGEGADIGGATLRGLFGYFGGDKGRQAGEATGQILGGGLGAQLNVTRMKAMGEAVNQFGGGIKSVGPAFTSARAKQAAGDERALWSIFADEFGGLRAQTRGFIQDFTNRSLASTIKKNIQATQMAEGFTKDLSTVKATPEETAPWGLAERTMVPALTESVARARPDSYAQTGEIAGRASAMKESIRGFYNRWVQGSKIPLDDKGIKASAETFQKITQAKVDALAGEQSKVKESFQKFTPQQEVSQGASLHEARDKLRDEAYARGAAKYQHAEELAGPEQHIESKGVREEGAAILKEFYSKVDPSTVPPVVRNMLSATKGEVAAAKELPGNIDAYVAAKETEKVAEAGKNLSLKEANDLYKAFGAAENDFRQSERWTEASHARALKEQVGRQIDSSKSLPEEARIAWKDAVSNWEKDYAGRFQQGLGKALGKERGGAYAGREVLLPEKVMDQVLSGETAMQEAENTFGRTPQLKHVIETGLTDRFRKEILDPKFTNEAAFERNIEKFKEKYGAALERTPELRDKIDSQAAKMLQLQSEKSAELQRYRDIMGGPIDRAVGPVQAKQMFQAALADPQKMQQLLKVTGAGGAKDLVKEVFQQANPFKNGEYDPDAIIKMLEAGKTKLDGPSSMEVLFKSAFGEKGAKQHMDTLEAIANFTKRQMATDPIHLQPGSLLSSNPVKEATGQTAASWISAWRAQAAGQTGASYFTTLGLTRFANAKVQASIEKAKHAALYDPEQATAILELVAKPATEAIGYTTAKKILGDIRTSDGSKLIDRLIDRGYVKAYVSRGALFGVSKALQDEAEKSPLEKRSGLTLSEMMGIGNAQGQSLDMDALRRQASEMTEKFNKENKGAGFQTYERRADGVHLFKKDGTVSKKVAIYNPKTKMYEEPPEPKK